MPTYSYECDACEHKYDKFQMMSDDPIKMCPSCGEEKARRLIGAGAGLIFKGSGFYITDYVKKSGEDKSKNGDSKTDDSKKKTEKKSTADKPATKKDK